MRRREFITLLGGAAAAWPLAAGAQQSAVPVIGFLNSGATDLAAFRKGLSEMGFVEGRSVAIEYRDVEDQDNRQRLQALAVELVRRQVAVIFASGGALAVPAAKAATTTIPIVFMTGADPVETGMVASLNRPGGNVTGFTNMATELTGKRLGLLHELVPSAARIAVLLNAGSGSAESFTNDMQQAASIIGRQIEILPARTSREIDTAFTDAAQKRADALLVTTTPLYVDRRAQIVTSATYHHLPTIFGERENVEIGGLMSYGASNADRARQVGLYVARILKGEKPADLPVQQATKFELVVNLPIARLLGLAVPATLLSLADEVIE